MCGRNTEIPVAHQRQKMQLFDKHHLALALRVPHGQVCIN